MCAFHYYLRLLSRAFVKCVIWVLDWIEMKLIELNFVSEFFSLQPNNDHDLCLWVESALSVVVDGCACHLI